LHGGIWDPASLTRELSKQDEISNIHKLWYAENLGVGGSFARIRTYFEKLQDKGPRRDYILEPSKSILVVQEHIRLQPRLLLRISASQLSQGQDT
jgi:hypothetical protein